VFVVGYEICALFWYLFRLLDEMCVKIFAKVSSGMRNSYSVTKVLLKHIKVPLSVHVRTSPVQLVVMTRNCTQIGVQGGITLSNTTQEEYFGTKKCTSVVNHKPLARKEKLSQDVQKYLNSKDYLKPVVGHLPQKILKRRKKNIDVLYAVDRDIARKCRPTYFVSVMGTRSLSFVLLLWDILPRCCSGVPVLRQDFSVNTIHPRAYSYVRLDILKLLVLTL
jgi:hypothetical protein